MEKDENQFFPVNSIILSFGWVAFIGGTTGLLFTFATIPPVQSIRDFSLVVVTFALPTIVALLGLLLIAIDRLINHLYSLSDNKQSNPPSSAKAPTNPPRDVP